MLTVIMMLMFKIIMNISPFTRRYLNLQLKKLLLVLRNFRSSSHRIYLCSCLKTGSQVNTGVAAESEPVFRYRLIGIRLLFLR